LAGYAWGCRARPGAADGSRLVPTEASGLYTPGRDGGGYLLSLRGRTLVAQEFDPVSLKLLGEFRQVAEPVTSSGASTQMNPTASAGGLLLDSASNTVSQFSWVD
jgi:hypothetical protein